MEAVNSAGGPGIADAKLLANWQTGALAAYLNERGLSIEQSVVGPSQLAVLASRIKDGTVSGRTAKEVFEAMCAGEGDADQIIERKGLRQVSDAGALEKAIDEVMAGNPEQLAAYRGGKDKLFGFFVGQVMKATGGKANPALVNELLKKKLAG